MKQFVTGIIDSLAISPKAALGNAPVFHAGPHRVYPEKLQLGQRHEKAAAHMKYMGKGSMTGLALETYV